MFFRHKILGLFFFLSLHASVTHGQNQHITVTSPSSGQSITPGQTIQVMWTVKDSGGGGTTKISLANSGTGFTRQISNLIDLTLVDVGVGSHTWSWSVDKSIPDGQGYTVNVQGSSYSDSSGPFVVGNGNVVKTSASATSSSTPQRTSSSSSSLIRPSSSRLNISTSSISSSITSSSAMTSTITSSSSMDSNATNTTSATATSTDDSDSSSDLSSFGKIGIVLGGILGLVLVSGGVMTLFSKIRRNRRKPEDDADAIPLARTFEPQILSPVPKFDPAPVYQPPPTYQQPRPPYGGRPPANPNYPHFGTPNRPPQPQRYAGGPQMMGRPMGGPPMGGPPMGGPPMGRPPMGGPSYGRGF